MMVNRMETHQRPMMKRLVGAAAIALIAVLVFASGASAQDGLDGNSSFALQVSNPVTIAAGERVENVVVIDGDATIDGRVENTLVVISGVATINGQVGENIVVIDGTLNLASTATVNSITLFSSELVQADGAVVNGDINDGAFDISLGFSLAGLFALWWIGVLLVTIVAGILFAWLGRDQLYGTVQTLQTGFVPSLVTALVLWIVLPIVSVILIFTVIGTPLGLASIGLLLPLLILLGLCVVGAWIGSYIIKPDTAAKGIGGTTLGIAILFLLSVIPFVGIFVGLAAMLGSGGFVYRAIKRSNDSDLQASSGPGSSAVSESA